MGVVNKSGDSKRAPKLSHVLFERSNRSFGSLVTLPSNVEAVEAGLLFVAGLKTLVAITGPSGWGKTHLLEASTYRLSHEVGTPVERLTALELVANPNRADQTCPLVLDDVQEILGKSRPQLALRLYLEKRVRSGRPTILAFTMPKSTRQLRSFLPSCRDWDVRSMAEPDPSERVTLLHQLSASEGMSLSPGLAKIIAYEMHGNGRTLSGALKRLRLEGTTWSGPAATLKACGVIDPFFADNPEWDLKLKIMKVAEANRTLFSRVSVTDLALVTMLREAGLSEADVAQRLSIAPADAYLRAARFQKLAEGDASIRGYVPKLVELVVESLES